MNHIRRAVIVICSLTLIFMFGCTAFMNLATPCYVPPQIKETVRHFEKESGETIEPNMTWPYDSIWHANEWKNALSYTQQQRQQKLLNDFKHNSDQFSWLDGILSSSIASAEEVKTTIFNPGGAIGSTVLPGLGITLGYMLKKPSDSTKKVVAKEPVAPKTDTQNT